MHIPVLLEETISYLNPQPNENFIDCTIDGGGHSLQIYKRIQPGGKILGIDWDKDILQKLERKLDKDTRKNFVLVCDNYRNLQNIVNNNRFFPVHGILFDLGMSLWHLEISGRGFSFQKDEPLDMRYNTAQRLTAKEIINKWPEKDLIRIFKEFGEEKRARAIAKAIVLRRQKSYVERTTELVEIIKEAISARYLAKLDRGSYQRSGRRHFATKVFQALRIAVNDELTNLEKGLEQAFDILTEGGRLVVISFHSLEDRIVKNFFKANARLGKIKILTKKPVTASKEEIEQNPSARSAKLRAASK